MCASSSSAASFSSRRTRAMRTLRRRGWLSDQHGSWAMMVAPPLLGWGLGGKLTWLFLLLMVAWGAAFHTFTALTLWVKAASSRHRLLVPSLSVSLACTAAAGIAFIVLRPHLLWWGVFFIPLAAAVLVLVWQRQERALATRLASVVFSSLGAPLAFSLASASGSPWDVSGHIWGVWAVLCFYLLASIPLVRSLIRGRRDPLWARSALLTHVVALLIVCALWGVQLISLWTLLVWAGLVVRAFALTFVSARRPRPIPPKIIGLTESAWLVLLLVSCFL